MMVGLMIMRGETHDTFAYNAVTDGFCLEGRSDDASDLSVP